jgi:tachykinin receptor 3
MVLSVFLIFVICWLPYHTYFIYAIYNPEVMNMKNIQHIFLGFYWCAMSHAMVNPFAYIFVNSK